MNVKQKILIADDSEINRALLMEILGDGYEYLEAENGVRAVALLREHTDIALVLLDIMMPQMDGFDVLKVMRCYSWLDEIPVIMISAAKDTANIERAYDLGVADYMRRPFERVMVLRQVQNVLMLYAKQKRLTRLVTDQVYEKEHNSVLMISILSHVVEFRNSESGLHVLHIRTLTDLLLHQLAGKTDRYQLDESDISLISTASALHDLGKIVIPTEILNKPGRLTAEEYAMIKTHTVKGARILRDLSNTIGGGNEPLLQVAYAICRWHHERWDGGGYPDKLKGDAIPIAAQVVALADVYDALTSDRCYKPAYDHDTALRMILNGECGAFNPLLLECLNESSELLRQELQRNEWDRSFHQDTHRLSEEILHREALPREGFPVQDLLRQAVGVLVEAAVPLVALQLLPQQLRRLIQAFQQQRVEGPALAVQDHAQGRVVVVGRFIAAVAGQGVVHICQCHHLCCDGDRIALQLVRVATAVPALMVPAADGIGHLQQGLVSPADGVAQVPQDAGTLHRVGLDHRVFFGGQAAGLVEDLGGDHDLAQVVQGRCRADERNVALVQLIPVGLARQLVQQQVGQGADVQHMQAALAVAELHHMAQDTDHQHAVVLFFVHLIGHQPGQALLLGIQHEHVLHLAQHHDPLKGAAHVVGHTQVVGTLDVGRVLCRRDHDHRDLVQPGIAAHDLQHVKAVHLRHHDVQQHQCDVRVLAQKRHRPDTVFRFQILIPVAQDLHQQRAVDLRIVCDQDLLFHIHVPCSSPSPSVNVLPCRSKNPLFTQKAAAPVHAGAAACRIILASFHQTGAAAPPKASPAPFPAATRVPAAPQAVRPVLHSRPQLLRAVPASGPAPALPDRQASGQPAALPFRHGPRPSAVPPGPAHRPLRGRHFPAAERSSGARRQTAGSGSGGSRRGPLPACGSAAAACRCPLPAPMLRPAPPPAGQSAAAELCFPA